VKPKGERIRDLNGELIQEFFYTLIKQNARAAGVVRKDQGH
jgi:hypothetical protein